MLGSLEKARASPRDTQRYLLCWPVKLLRCPNPVSVLREATVLLTSTQDAELASRGQDDVVQQQQQTPTQDQLLQPDEQQHENQDNILEGLETLEEVDAFCATFEEKHSLQTIW